MKVLNTKFKNLFLIKLDKISLSNFLTAITVETISLWNLYQIINITINSDGTETQDNQGDDQDQQNLALRIRDVVRQTINEEKRLGGSLRMQ